MSIDTQVGAPRHVLTVYKALLPEGLGTAEDRLGAERSTSGVNLLACIVIMEESARS